MKKIYAKAVEMADSISLKEKLIAIVAKINESDYGERFLDILFDADVKEEELPCIVEKYKEIRTKISFNYLDDRITYKYERTDTRYFINENDATEYSKSGKYDYSTSKNISDDGYPYEAKYFYCSESYCNLYEWMNSKVIEK